MLSSVEFKSAFGRRLRAIVIVLVAFFLAGLAMLLVTRFSARTPVLQLAYLDRLGNIWLVDAEGRNKEQVMGVDRCRPPGFLFLSPAGDRIACETTPSFPGATVVIVDAQGRFVYETKMTTQFSWSPTGRHFVYADVSDGSPRGTTYVVADAVGKLVVRIDGTEGAVAWSPDGSALAYSLDPGRVGIYNLAMGRRRKLEVHVDLPFRWVLSGRALLVARDYRFEGELAQYEAFLLDVERGELSRISALDGTQFWVTQDGGKVVFPLLDPGVSGRLAILDLQTLKVSVIKGSSIAYPSEYIPESNVSFSADGSEVYWLTVNSESVIYRAHLDGTGLTRIATFPDDVLIVGFSPDQARVAFVRGDTQAPSGLAAALWVANIDGTGARKIASEQQGILDFTWRPKPPR